MKKYIVTQCCRCSFTEKATEENKGKIRAYKFSKDLNPGVYSEEEFLSIVGKQFIESGKFEEYCKIGWIRVEKVEDVTSKVIKNFNKL